MVNQEVQTSERFRVGFRKDVVTHHFPITVANGLDVLLKPGGYIRLPQTDSTAEEFVWENDKRERFVVYYYTEIDGIGHSSTFDEDYNCTVDDLDVLYNNLNATVGALSQNLGSPYLSSTHELMLEIEGSNPIEKAQFVIPVVRELYKKKEGMQVFSVDILDQTDSTVQILFGYLE